MRTLAATTIDETTYPKSEWQTEQCQKPLGPIAYVRMCLYCSNSVLLFHYAFQFHSPIENANHRPLNCLPLSCTFVCCFYRAPWWSCHAPVRVALLTNVLWRPLLLISLPYRRDGCTLDSPLTILCSGSLLLCSIPWPLLRIGQHTIRFQLTEEMDYY